MTKKKELKWYEVKEPSYINERLCQTGEIVQYDGEAGDNLRELSDKEVKAHLKQDQQDEKPEEVDLDAREADLNKREDEINDLQRKVVEDQERLDLALAGVEERSKELNAREAVLAAKEAIVPVGPVFVDAQGKAKK
jgi:hypothetical protein